VQHEKPILDWIAAQDIRMRDRLIEYARINTFTNNIAGLEQFAALMKIHAAVLDGEITEHQLPPYTTIDSRGNPSSVPLGPAISIIKRPEASRRILLAIHMDTVYPPDDPAHDVTSPLDDATSLLDGKLTGPGVADAKGGLVVMLTALEALERSDVAKNIGWQVLINPDEEIGSPGSAALFSRAARNNHLGLLFEPALADGALVDRRRGSGNFSVVIRGRSAHAGRDFAKGRSAVVAAAGLTTQLHALNAAIPGVTVNIGAIEGGGPPNVVPDLAICRLNIRTTETADETKVMSAVKTLLEQLNDQEGIRAQLHGNFSSPPKIPDERGQALLDATLRCGRELGLNLQTRPSGGACDGNRLAADGLPNVDSLGVRGGDIHSPDEYMFLDSLTERAQLCALLLMRIASGSCQL
jgi:glutamate carboxypeptidase